jgi:hypothetical protein
MGLSVITVKNGKTGLFMIQIVQLSANQITVKDSECSKALLGQKKAPEEKGANPKTSRGED